MAARTAPSPDGQTFVKARLAAGFVAAVLVIATPAAIHWEGKRNRTYLDVADVPTVCYGQTGARVRLGETYSDQTCMQWLQDELQHYLQGLSACVRSPMHAHQAAALTLFAYNVGVSGACSSAAVRYASRGDWANACRALQFNDRGEPAWSYITDPKTGQRRFVQGLANRRAAERALCESSS